MRATTILFLMSALASGSVGCQKTLREASAARTEETPEGEAQDPVQPPQQPTVDNGLPSLTSATPPNEWVRQYFDTVPYVRDPFINWDNAQIKQALRNLRAGWRSTFVYGEWKIAYGLESQSNADTAKRQAAVARNFIRVLLGENRDYPEMIRRKLEVINGGGQVYAGGTEVADFVTENPDGTPANLFSQITYPAYVRMTTVMAALHSYKEAQARLDPNFIRQFQADPDLPLLAEADRHHFGFGDSEHNSNRVSRSVPPWTHCEMKYMFDRFMTADGDNDPVTCEHNDWGDYCSCDEQCVQRYVNGYLGVAGGPPSYKDTECTAQDFEYMYNFRGHKVFQPLWLDSNAFIWNSRRAGAVINRNKKIEGDPSYYLHPFASRYTRSRQALAAYLLYPDDHHQAMIQASESGGGPIMYITDQDTDHNNVADYRFFTDRNGCGDTGPSGDDPASNCNMVEWETAAATASTTGAISGWDASMFARPDMGFMATVTSFGDRMARFNQALDRHTNWGPTGYYMLDTPIQNMVAGQPSGEPRPNFIGAYSPIVACSYDISASNSFASGSYSTTMPFEQGHTKWMFIMRFKTSDYYDERNMLAGQPIDFDRNYFNETSLSNDYYHERALDRFGWVPAGDIYANVYFVYGSRLSKNQMTAEEFAAETSRDIDVPPPDGWHPSTEQQ